jgi:hypothetical protein
MSTDVETTAPAGFGETFEGYRALCPAAVTSLLFGLLSILAFLDVFLLLIPALGIMVGVYALVQIRDRPAELTGNGLAYAGIGCSAVLLVACGAYAVYVYMTEVPPGFTRISYRQLQPQEGVADQLYPPLVEELDGKKVFIKGYVFPGPQKQGIRTFLLVRDKGDCCFGGNPRITDRIQVTLANQRLSFSSGLFKVAGTFRLEQKPKKAVDAGGACFYYLDDCELR